MSLRRIKAILLIVALGRQKRIDRKAKSSFVADQVSQARTTTSEPVQQPPQPALSKEKKGGSRADQLFH